MRFICIIPARYASKRFPGKVLASLGGASVIRRVYERASSVFEDTVVATDDERVFEHVLSFGGRALMTRPDHKCGTDRCFEAYTKLSTEYDVLINLQGDEPFVERCQLESLADCFKDPTVQIASIAHPLQGKHALQDLKDNNVIKVLMDNSMNAIYFSRHPVPFIRDASFDEWANVHTFYKHIGIYGFRPDVLKTVISLPESSLEKAERLEQLRWIQNGYAIRMVLSPTDTIGIDTPADLEFALDSLSAKPQ